MAFRDGPLQDLKVPIAWIGALSAIVAACIALGLLLTDNRERPDGGTYGNARGEFSEAVRPVGSALAAPMRGLGSLGDEISGYFFAVSENRKLKARIKELERIRDDAVALKNINTRYEQLLQLRTEPAVPMVTARAVTDARGPFSNARLIDAGVERDVRVGYPVMSDHGVVGRVIGVGRGVSRVLLLTDVDSRMPVLVDRTSARAILTGDGGGAPRLEYLRGHDPIQAGDLILSSGDGGMFPRGLPVGVAAKDIKGGWRVRLYAEAQDVDYVRVLQFDDFSKLAAQAALAAKTLPPLPAADAAQLALATASRAAPAPGAAQAGAKLAAAGGPATAPHPALAATAPTAALRPTTLPASAGPKASPSSSLARSGTTDAAHRTPPPAAPGVKPKPKPAKRPRAAPTSDRMAPIPDDYQPPQARSRGAIAPDLEAAMRRDNGR